MKIGQLCIKLAGRDGGQFCLVVDKIDDTYVLIDGNVRRKKCNIKHLEALDKVLKIKKKASTEEVKKALELEGIKILKKGEPRKPAKKLIKKRKVKQKPKEEKKKKKEEKKETKKEPKKKEEESKK